MLYSLFVSSFLCLFFLAKSLFACLLLAFSLTYLVDRFFAYFFVSFSVKVAVIYCCFYRFHRIPGKKNFYLSPLRNSPSETLTPKSR